MTLIRFICLGIIGVALIGTGQAIGQDTKPLFTFGAIADCQYCDNPTAGRREYRLSPEKLTRCVEHLNKQELAFVVHLGDFIDRDFKSFSVVSPIFAKLKAPGRHVLGNHDFSVADDKKLLVPKTMNMPSRYYDYSVGKWRFIILDSNDMSFYAHPKNSPEHRASVDYYTKHKLKAPKYNGAVGPKQLAWVKEVLQKATKSKERVILFAHHPVYPKSAGHNVWNAEEIVALLEGYPCVAAYLNGHNHAGHYGIKKGIHYLTLQGMVDTKKTSYATIAVFKDQLKITGFGREKDRTLAVRKIVAPK
jgi:manganese-dependent ADP-ribose/CDP-alcohol diphosphatase